MNHFPPDLFCQLQTFVFGECIQWWAVDEQLAVVQRMSNPIVNDITMIDWGDICGVFRIRV